MIKAEIVEKLAIRAINLNGSSPREMAIVKRNGWIIKDRLYRTRFIIC